MTTTTTIQVSRNTAESLKRLFPGYTYDEILKKVASGQAVDLLSQLDNYIVPFKKTINPATWDEENRRVGLHGVITSALMHFPAGPIGLVEARIMLNSKGHDRPIVPTLEDSYIALEDETYEATGLCIPVAPGDVIRTEWYNYDGKEPHTVPVEVTILKFAGQR